MAEKKKSPLQLEQESLQKPMGLKRTLSWILFVPLILACLFIPLIAINAPGLLGGATAEPVEANQKLTLDQVPANAHPSIKQEGSLESTRRITAHALDSIWNPGPLAAAHSNLEGDCQSCHEGNFSRVKDSGCTSCHSNMGLHVSEQTLPDTSFSEGRCAGCHHDHKGAESLAEQNKHFIGADCASCHTNIKEVAPKTETLAVADFSGDKHPAFRLTVATGPESADLRRIRMAKDVVIKETNSLKFPHDVHLDKKGIEGPNKKVVMQCADCHKPADTPSGFEKTTMKDHCQSCHKLSFEPALPDRQVPHGNVQDALSTVEEFYAYLALHPEEKNQINRQRAVLRARPGEKEPNRSTLGALGGDPRLQARFAVQELFESTSCNVCHVVKPVSGIGNTKTTGSRMPQYSIAKVKPEHAWMPMAKFDHKAHEFESCTSCHKATESKKTSDVLMPDIQSCQECHAGSKPSLNKVKSDCGVCHEYHIHEKAPTKQKVQTALSK